MNWIKKVYLILEHKTNTMKTTLLILFIGITGLGMGQVVFDETHEIATRGKDVVEFNNRYVVSHSNGITSFDKNTGLNPVYEFDPSICVMDTNINYSIQEICKLSQNELIVGIFEQYSLYLADAIIVKLDNNYDTLWTYRLSEDSCFLLIKSISATDDGGCIIGVNKDNFPTWGYSIKLIKIDSSGILEWSKELRVNGVGDNFGESSIEKIIKSSDGNFIGAGRRDTLLCGGKSFWLFKFDPTGNILWEQYIHPQFTVGGSYSDTYYTKDMVELSNGNFQVVGNHNIGGGNAYTGNYWDSGRPYSLLTDNNGNTIRDSTYFNIVWGGFGNICHKNGNTYATYGYENVTTYYDNTVFVKFNTDLSMNSIDTAHLFYDYNSTSSMIFDSDSAIVFTGRFDGSLWLYKYNPSISSVEDISNVEIDLVIYPNPTSNLITIQSKNSLNNKFKVFDQQGREVISGKLKGVSTEVSLGKISRGIYTIKVEGNFKPAVIVKD